MIYTADDQKRINYATNGAVPTRQAGAADGGAHGPRYRGWSRRRPLQTATEQKIQTRPSLGMAFEQLGGHHPLALMFHSSGFKPKGDPLLFWGWFWWL